MEADAPAASGAEDVQAAVLRAGVLPAAVGLADADDSVFGGKNGFHFRNGY